MKDSSRPRAINLHKNNRQLELVYENDEAVRFSFEYLRISSPSAEVRGHGTNEERPLPGKKNVLITDIKQIGNYAIQIVFDDEHNSGIYSWEYLKYLSANKDILWAKYVKTLSNVGLSRDPNEHVLRFET